MTIQPISSPLLGVCYYPEHWPRARWDMDAQMMVEAGIKIVRIGEFAWSRLEPRQGDYQFDWLAEAIDVLAAHGLQIVLGTPTATPPKWLVDQMPDMVAMDAYGQPRRFGSRRHYCFSHRAYRAECARITEALAARFGQHQAIIAWQTDNEYGCHDTIESYSKAAEIGFRQWLIETYQTIDALNLAWGTVFWSMDYQDFTQIDLPDRTVTEPNPSHCLDFQRYSSDQVVAFNKVQTDILRRLAPDHALLHNYMGAFQAFDHFDVSEDLDIATWDSYPVGFLDRDDTDEARQKRYMRVGDPDHQALHHDLYRACGKGRMWVMEQQPGPVNWAPHNPSPAKGAVRLWTYEAFAAGAEVVSYFRWRQPHFGQEQMHEALLLPDATPNEAYHVAQNIAHELQSLGDIQAVEPADVALIYDYESAWAWKIQPQSAGFIYHHIVMDFYRALRALGLSVDILPPRASAIANHKLIVVPSMMALETDFVDALAASNAQVIFGPRCGAKTSDLHIPATLPPGAALQKHLPFKIWRVDSLPQGEHVAYDEQRHFSIWREFIIILDDKAAQITAHTADGEAAMISNLTGTLHYIAGWPNDVWLKEIVAAKAQQAGLTTHDLHQDIRLRDTASVRFIFNHGPEAVDVSLWAEDREIMLGETMLAPCGVLVARHKMGD